jgi:hypothetical protein
MMRSTQSDTPAAAVEETTAKRLRSASANSSDVKGGVLPAECAVPLTLRGRFA